MRYAEYLVTVKHDKGRVKFRTMASSENAARDIICAAENCPPAAIIKVKEIRLIYNTTQTP